MAKNSRTDRRKWTAEKKIEILRSHFAKAKLIDTCEEFRVHPNLLSSWWKAALEAALPSLSGKAAVKSGAWKKQISIMSRSLETRMRS